MDRRRSIEELYRLHVDAGEWAEASKLFMQIMARDYGWGREFFKAIHDQAAERHALRQRVNYTDAEADQLDREEFIEEQSLGGRTYEERR